MDKSTFKEIKKLREAIKAHKKLGDIDMFARIKTIIAFLTKKSIEKIASYFDISTKTVRRWIRAYEKEGIDGLLIAPRSGRPPKLNEEELNKLKKMIEDDQERVWVARHVFILIATLFSVVYSIKYLPEVLKKIGLSFHKAVHYLIKRNEEKRSAWIQESLPKIYEEHIKQGWKIFFQDEVGFQTEGTLSYSWGPKGKKIIVKNKGRHGRANLIGAYEVGSGFFFIKQHYSELMLFDLNDSYVV
jgi:transposase